MSGHNIVTVLYYTAWIAPRVAEVAIVAVMFRKQLWRDFPLFFSYLVFEVLRTSLLLSVQVVSPRYYFRIYWASETIEVVLLLLVTQELFINVLKPYRGLAALARVLFRWSLIVMLAIAFFVVLAHPDNEWRLLPAQVFTVKRAACIVEAGLLGFLFTLRSVFAIPFRHYVFGVAAGLALNASVALVAYMSRASWGVLAHPTLVWTTMMANNCAALVWLRYSLAKPSGIQLTSSQRERILEWDRQLEALTQG